MRDLAGSGKLPRASIIREEWVKVSEMFREACPEEEKLEPKRETDPDAHGRGGGGAGPGRGGSAALAVAVAALLGFLCV